MVLARGRYDGDSLTNVQELYVSDPTSAGGSRLAFAPDGTIYMTVSGAGGGGPRGNNPRKDHPPFGQGVSVRGGGALSPRNPFVWKSGPPADKHPQGDRATAC